MDNEPFHLVEARVPNEFADRLFAGKADRMPFRSVDPEQLAELNSVGEVTRWNPCTARGEVMNSHPPSAFIVATVRLLPTAEGGRRAPIISGYRCSCWIGHTDVDGRTYNDATLYLIDTESLAPGNTASARVRPHDPDAWSMLTEVRGSNCARGRARSGWRP